MITKIYVPYNFPVKIQKLWCDILSKSCVGDGFKTTSVLCCCALVLALHRTCLGLQSLHYKSLYCKAYLH